MLLSIVIPALNEERYLENVISRIKALSESNLSFQIIVVDDGSTDGTYSIAQRVLDRDNDRLLRHSRNLGKGAALKTASEVISGDFVVIQDADLEYSPEEIPRVVGPLVANLADVVYGSRFSGSEAKRVLYFWHALGNRFLTLISNFFSNLNLTDMETGYKAFRTDVFKALNLREKGFGVEPEITAKISKMDLRVYEVSISYRGRTYSEGKKIGWKDGVWALWCIVRYSLFAQSKPTN